MNKPVIKVENLSKQYRLGEVGTGTISHDLNRWWHKIRGKEDPYLRIGESNDRSKKGDSEFVWALRDINFEVQQGEVLGIIGKNGAGKSTLLKILSKVTAPTTGSIKAKGRIASLLEVGTGFHPELTGRENIYLNGTILGMTKREVSAKLDEIVDFAGVERYLDTPVKRYSSGMMVRLGFAVAAHLEPEILIVDEVLAVGDVEFQKKAVGKMKEVSKDGGRTVLFVSHNMTAVKNLCDYSLIIEKGRSLNIGKTDLIINQYILNTGNKTLIKRFDKISEAPGNEHVSLKRIEIVHAESNHGLITVGTPIDIEFEFWNYNDNLSINLSLHLNSIDDSCVFNVVSPVVKTTKGLYKGVCKIPGDFLNDGVFNISMMLVEELSHVIFNFENIISFEVTENRVISGWHGKWPGYVRPKLEFTLEQVQ